MIRRRTLALAVALALAGTLMFPSAAAPLLDSSGDEVGEDVELLPAADSEYATVGPDGELALDLSPGSVGLNPGSVTSFGDVFYVQYTGDRDAEVWLSTGSEAVSFAVDGRAADSRADRATVEPGAVLPVSVRVDSTEGDVDVDEVTVHSRVAEAEEDSDGDRATTDSTDSTAEASAPAVQRLASGTGSVSFTMLAPTAGEPLTLDTDGMVVAGESERAASLESVTVTPASGDATTVDVERAASTAAGPLPDGAAETLGAVRVEATSAVDAATFRLAVDDALLAGAAADAGELALYRQSDGEWSEVSLSVVDEREDGVVVEGTTPGFSTFVLAAERPDLGVTGASVSPATIGANDSAAVTATVRNDGGAAGERSVAVTVGGEVVAERSVALDTGESTTVTASVAPGPGEHAVGVGGVDAGTLVVEPGESDAQAANERDSGEDDEPGPEDDPLDEPAGFDFATLVSAGLAAALVVVGVGLVRRWRGGAE